MFPGKIDENSNVIWEVYEIDIKVHHLLGALCFELLAIPHHYHQVFYS